jgi:FtsP/CotA-like multicopper oxidase with cupredoxin domain
MKSRHALLATASCQLWNLTTVLQPEKTWFDLMLTGVVFIALAWHPEVRANCSLNTNIPATINYTNSSSFAVDVIWVSPDCSERIITNLAPGAKYTASTYKNDVWRTRKTVDRSMVTETQPIASPATVTITDPPPPITVAQLANPSALTTPSVLSLPPALARSSMPTSPRNTPFVDPLPVPVPMTPVTSPNPVPTNASNSALVPAERVVNAKINGVTVASASIGGFSEAARPNHQKWTQFGGTSETEPGYTGTLYESVEMAVPWSFYPAVDNVPTSKIWTYVEANTGAVRTIINAQYGQPVIHRIHNALPLDNGGFGVNQTSTHLHNGHTPSESDGGPTHFYDPGKFKDYHYPNVRAGFASNVPTSSLNGRTVIGDVKETMSTLWFHDHRFDHTAENVYKGLVGNYSLFSNDILLDTGDETTGLKLPSGQYDVPMVFGDRNFDPVTGELAFDTTNIDGILGDKFVVNGKIQPYFNVQKRKYRFRLQNGGPSRYYQFFLSNNANFKQLSTNGNLLPSVLTVRSIRLSVAERADVIVDFTAVPAGTKVYLQNRLEQKDGRGPTGNIIAPTNLVEFRVQEGAVVDNSVVPTTILPLPDKKQVVSKNRTFEFTTNNGAWTVNGELYDPNTIKIFPKQNAKEKWSFKSGGGWGHPVHVHFEEGQILSRDDNTKLVADDVGRKDVYRIGDSAIGTNNTGKVDTFYQWRDFQGDYPIHCHNSIHEDHAMMTTFEIVP